ncbi:cytochrome o ubiquinol oxidase subunit IV [Novosphingobium sp. G106]|uniref:cytochrome o ubiquinol oxidase subunit IV n=1 Tax=Novosphingobium sp. G106 TaxID=2849500 RepID=UPI001C2D9503|nr:cytochrome o ubiquinol oxidase subunit IV [Novosphingobium sp. G106]MBV1692002.1 cytochrome o ubiquinol oxidase subunit IV [Novosphingobium sp. G106]
MSAHQDHPVDQGAHGSLRDYVIGFALSVVLTAVPFWLVMTQQLADGPTAAIILVFAAVQMVVHVIYFLHMNGRQEGGWTMMAMIFTVIIVVIMLTGSLWVMYHLNHNMMPMSHDMSQMP